MSNDNFFIDFVRKIIDSLFGKQGSKSCGIPKLDILYKKIGKDNPYSHIVILKKKSSEIDKFLIAYKTEALKYGKIFESTFAQFPKDYGNTVSKAWEDIHMLRKDEYRLGMAGWLPECPIEYTSFIADHVHHWLNGNTYNVYCEEKMGYVPNSNSIELYPIHEIFCLWLKESREIINNIPTFVQTQEPQKVYYRGSLKKLSIYFLFILSRLGCNIIIEPSPNTDINKLLYGIPNVIKIDIV